MPLATQSCLWRPRSLPTLAPILPEKESSKRMPPEDPPGRTADHPPDEGMTRSYSAGHITCAPSYKGRGNPEALLDAFRQARGVSSFRPMPPVSIPSNPSSSAGAPTRNRHRPERRITPPVPARSKRSGRPWPPKVAAMSEMPMTCLLPTKPATTPIGSWRQEALAKGLRLPRNRLVASCRLHGIWHYTRTGSRRPPP
jgi:hypothetical protein